MTSTKLSNVRPDFESLVADLRAGLGSYDSWEDILPFAAGTAMIDFVSAIGTMLNYSVEKAAQEANFDTQGLDSSTYRVARMLGVNPSRRYPARVVVDLIVNSTVSSIPRYSQFQVDGIDYYNSEPITVAVGSGISVQNVALFQGTIEQKRFVGSGEAYQVLRFGGDFTVSDHFINVRVGSTEFTRVKHPLWMTIDEETDPFWDTTLPDGSVQLVFGNEQFGTIPEVGSQILVTYAETLGTGGNTPESNLDVSLVDTVPGISALTGVSKSAGLGGTPSGGKDADSPEDLKWTAPRLYAAGDRAVRRDDWRALMIDWEEADIVDAGVWGEHEERFVGTGCFGPFNMNVVYICPLLLEGTIDNVYVGDDILGDPVYQDKSNDLILFMDDKKYVNSNLILRTPEGLGIHLDVSVYVFTGVQVDYITTTLTTALNALFSRRKGALGATYQRTDITDVIQSYSQVDYCRINSIKHDIESVLTEVDTIVMSKLQFATLENLTLTVQTTERN